MHLGLELDGGLLSRLPRWAILGLAVLLVVLVGIGHYMTGQQISFSLFYLPPVFLTAWHVGRRSAVAISVLSMISWDLAEVSAGMVGFDEPYIYWNGVVRLGFFLSVGLLAAELRRALAAETMSARTDHLTGLSNSRNFHLLAEVELARARRYGRPFAMVYIDLDGFKQANDRLGHQEGDRLLKAVGGAIKGGLRSTDIAARLGGDEFALLLPETGLNEAKVVIGRLMANVREAASSPDVQVGSSAGVAVYLTPPGTVSDALHNADELMYEAKAAGKGTAIYGTYGADIVVPESAEAGDTVREGDSSEPRLASE